MFPIECPENIEISQASEKFVNAHRKKSSKEKVIKQVIVLIFYRSNLEAF